MPMYTKLTRQENNGLIMLFLQMYETVQRKNIIVRKSGGADYTSLTRAIMDSMGIWGVTIYVDEGEYDILAELAEYYGTYDFQSLTPSTRGIELGWDITIKSSPHAVIKANYTGDDFDMLTRFSVFNCYNKPNVGGFTLIGVNIQCSRIRYCVHDEKTMSGVGSYNNRYENCNMYIDNRNNPNWDLGCCIGCGLGTGGCVTITNCCFEGLDVRDHKRQIIGFHNNGSTGTSSAQSFITVKDNYFKNGGITVWNYGESTLMTKVLITNNNMVEAIYYPGITQEAPVENMEILEWNNIIRS